MCENEGNNTVRLIQQKFNEITQKYFGELENTELYEKVDPV